MKKIRTQLMTVLFVLTALLPFFVFSAADVSADFYVVAGSRGVGTVIRSLPYTISEPGFYYINKDLTCAAGSHGITITADNVTVDLMGFSLIGSYTPGDTPGSCDGFYLYERSNVEIRNGTVRNFSQHGVYGYDGTGHRILNIRALNSGQSGILITGRNHCIERCTATNNGDRGISAGYGSSVIDNVCYSNTDDGIYARNGSTVKDNTCLTNGKEGIEALYGSTTAGNTCYQNGGDGIIAWAGSTITDNTCYDNGRHGILAHSDTTVTGNTCRGNTEHGIRLTGDSFVGRNTAVNNGTNMNDPGDCTFGGNHTPS